MVRLEEYKSGNYILFQSDLTSRYEVVETKEKALKIKSVKDGTEAWHEASSEEIRPAVLNEEWLIGFGFHKDVWMERDIELAVNFTLITDGTTIRVRTLDPYYELVEPYQGKIPLPKMKYVHLLQNFYEEQTGKCLRHTS